MRRREGGQGGFRRGGLSVPRVIVGGVVLDELLVGLAVFDYGGLCYCWCRCDGRCGGLGVGWSRGGHWLLLLGRGGGGPLLAVPNLA